MTNNTTINRRAPMLLFWLSCVFFGLSTSIFDALYVLHLTALGFPQDNIGLIFSTGFIVMAITLVVMVGNMIRLSAGVLLKASAALFAACMMIFPFLESYYGHLIIFAACSLASAIMMSAETAAMLEYVEEKRQRAFFNNFFLIFLSSSGVGTFIIAMIELSKEEARGIDLFSDFLMLAGVLSVAMALLRFFIYFQPYAAEKVSAIRALPSLLFQSHYYFTLFVSFFIGASAVLPARYINLLLVERLQMGVDQALIWLSIERLVCFLSLGFYAWKIKFINNNRASMALLLLSGCFFGLASVTTIPLLFIIFYLLRQAAHYSQIPILEHVSFDQVPAQYRAQAGFIRQLGLFLGGAVGAFFYGKIFEEGSSENAILLAAAFSIVAAGAFFLRHIGCFKPFASPHNTQGGAE